MTDDELRRAFEEGTVSKDDWDHRAHLRMAHLYLRDGSLEEALPRLREGLRALLERFGIEDGPTRGYHETITVAWLRLVRAAMWDAPESSFDALLEDHAYLREKRLLRLFYSRERLMSAEAKRAFVDGDRLRLPE